MSYDWLQILCLHGGIPHPSLGNGLLSAINEIPNVLPNPDVDSLLGWELMWNDPIRCEVHVIMVILQLYIIAEMKTSLRK